MKSASLSAFAVLLVASTIATAPAALAENAPWRVSKASGDVWVGQDGAQRVALAPQAELKSGDTIHTGRNGRVLLARGSETILVAPNSVIGIPTDKKAGLATTITQQAGSILLEVEKRNVKHFEVETPYLAAVVKGTRFVVTVDEAGTRVSVERGQVEVQDFKSGQVAQVMPGQAAQTFAAGRAGLSLSGAGALQPIQNGMPRTPTINRVPVPKGGAAATQSLARSASVARVPGTAKGISSAHRSVAVQPHRGLRISSALGEVKLNIRQVTHGLVRGSAPAADLSGRRGARNAGWNANDSASAGSAAGNGNAARNAASAAVSAGTIGNGISNKDFGGSGKGNGHGNAGTGNSGNGNGNAGSGNNGNGIGHAGNGNNGNGNGNAVNGNNGNGNSTAGNGNNGNGNGNAGKGNNGRGGRNG